MDALISDFLYAFRVFFKRPGLTILAIIALAVSLGMSTTAFSTLNGMFFKPLPFKDPENLLAIYLSGKDQEMGRMPVPYEHLADIEEMEAFSETMAYLPGTVNVSGRGMPRRYDGCFISTNFMDMLGKGVLLGRTFSPTGQTDGLGELLISYDAWQDHFRGDPDVIGTRVRVNGLDSTIIGVVEEGFHFPIQSQAWVPLKSHLFLGQRPHLTHVYPLARLAPGHDPEATQAELNNRLMSWSNVTMESKQDIQLLCLPFGRLPMNRASESLLVAAIGAVIFVLLVSCANVANLLVGRAMSRGREMAIRSAVGASRGRIVRQLLTESLLLSFFGAIGGLIYAAWAVDVSMESDIYELPYWMSFELDWRVFLFAVVVMLMTALVSGLIPAWQSSKINLNEMLKDTSHTSTSFRLGKMTRTLAVVQIAFSCALLFGAGLITRNVYRMANVDPGYDGSHYLTMRMGLLYPDSYPSEESRDVFFNQLIHKVQQTPGVEGAAVTSWIAHTGNLRQPFLKSTASDGQPEFGYAYWESVSRDYFDAFDLGLIEGSIFDTAPVEGPHVAVVNDTFARQHFGEESPVGKTIARIVDKGADGMEKTQSMTILGVVPTIRVSNFTKPKADEAIVYIPYTQADSTFMSLVVKSYTDDFDALEESIQKVILTLDPDLPVYFTKTMESYVEDQIYPYRVQANSFLFIGLMALFLAAIGVYGMLAFNVSRRRREIGIRMALGATSIGIVTQVLWQGFIQVTLGLLVGTILAFLVGQITRGFLFGVNPTDPSVYLGVLLTIVGVAILSFFIPARRAASLSPMEALRYE